MALDIDGTLAGADHRVSDRSVRAVRRLADVGVTAIIVTGRTERAARTLSDQIGLQSPIISCNGAVITDPGTNQHRFLAHVNPETVARILDFGWRHELDSVVWTTTAMVARRTSEGTELLEAVNREPVAIASLDSVRDTDIIKVMLSGRSDALDSVQEEVRQRIPELQRSMDRFYETSIPGASKREALRRVLRDLGMTSEQCLGIADGDTDVGWLSDVGIPVAVSNARGSIQALARIHIGHHAEDSVASFLESYFALGAD